MDVDSYIILKISFLPAPLELLFLSIYLQIDLISLEYYPQNFLVLSFCSIERDTNVMLVTLRPMGTSEGHAFSRQKL